MKINKKRRIKSKRNIESIVAAISLYGLTKDDLANRQRLDEACIRLNADLALIKSRRLSGRYSPYPIPENRKKTGRGYVRYHFIPGD